MTFGFLFGVILLFVSPFLAAGPKPVINIKQSADLKSTTLQLQQKSPKIQRQQATPRQQQPIQYRESEWDVQRRAIEQNLLYRDCENLQRRCLSNFVAEAHWDLRRDEVEACAVTSNEGCQQFPIRSIYIDVWPNMRPPIEMLPGRVDFIPGSIELRLECRRDWERCRIIYFYGYDNPERLTVVIRPEEASQSPPLDPLPGEDDEAAEPPREAARAANNCYHPPPYAVTDYGAVTLNEFTLAQINLYGSSRGCYLPDRNGCYQEVSSNQATALWQCPGDFIYQGRDGRYAIPCQYKFDRYQFAFADGLPDDAMFCYIHFLRPRRLD